MSQSAGMSPSGEAGASSRSSPATGTPGGAVAAPSVWRRLWNSTQSIFLGVLLLVAGVPLVYWNESQAVDTHRQQLAGASSAPRVNIQHIEAQHEGKLVYATGPVTVRVPVTEPTFQFPIAAVRVDRQVELRQWVEKPAASPSASGSSPSAPTYEAQWSQVFIDSHRYRDASHRNPVHKPIDDKVVSASQVFLGSFQLTSELVDQLATWSEWRVTDEVWQKVPASKRAGWELHEGLLFRGKDPLKPAVGDARVRYRVVRPDQVSLLAKQSGATLTTNRAGSGPAFAIRPGTVSPETLFRQAFTPSQFFTVMLRWVGFLLIWIGLGNLLHWLSRPLSAIPYLGDLLATGRLIASLFLSGAATLAIVGSVWLGTASLYAMGVWSQSLLTVLLPAWLSRWWRRPAAATKTPS